MGVGTIIVKKFDSIRDLSPWLLDPCLDRSLSYRFLLSVNCKELELVSLLLSERGCSSSLFKRTNCDIGIICVCPLRNVVDSDSGCFTSDSSRFGGDRLAVVSGMNVGPR